LSEKISPGLGKRNQIFLQIILKKMKRLSLIKTGETKVRLQRTQ
jgi:hypothetical protein